VAGTGLGFNALVDLDIRAGAVISCIIALGIFWFKHAGKVVDGFVKLLGVMMILFTLYIAIVSRPPVGEALYRMVWPEKIDLLKIVTLVGGTVGGYISFAGAHRLLDANIKGKEALPQVTRSSVSGIVITSTMRFVLFFAALGVVYNGGQLLETNPAASVFRIAAGELGFRFFGFVMWAAAITSVVGASYTSVSFLKTLHPFIEKYERFIVSGFILLSTLLFLFFNKSGATRLLIFAGTVNGLILPVALVIILLASVRRSIVGDYRHPLWMQAAGWIVVIAAAYMGIVTIEKNWDQLF
jgi:Mn2+/Fe2+ NRAMP family transporter